MQNATDIEGSFKGNSCYEIRVQIHFAAVEFCSSHAQLECKKYSTKHIRVSYVHPFVNMIRMYSMNVGLLKH